MRTENHLRVKLRTDISSAQKRLNIFGGEIPDKELSEKLRGYMKECGDYFKPNRPQWVDEIDEKYGLKTKGATDNGGLRIFEGFD
nr:MAG TPA: hypothetical protein [Caudoviricetes sp.]